MGDFRGGLPRYADYSDVLPSTIGQNPSFYLNEEISTRALLAPYLQRASQFLDNILHSLPGLPDKIKDLFSFAESSKSLLPLCCLGSNLTP